MSQHATAAVCLICSGGAVLFLYSGRFREMKESTKPVVALAALPASVAVVFGVMFLAITLVGFVVAVLAAPIDERLLSFPPPDRRT